MVFYVAGLYLQTVVDHPYWVVGRYHGQSCLVEQLTMIRCPCCFLSESCTTLYHNVWQYNLTSATCNASFNPFFLAWVKAGTKSGIFPAYDKAITVYIITGFSTLTEGSPLKSTPTILHCGGDLSLYWLANSTVSMASWKDCRRSMDNSMLYIHIQCLSYHPHAHLTIMSVPQDKASPTPLNTASM